jgi:Na+/melibiose symporter-like transporter
MNCINGFQFEDPKIPFAILTSVQSFFVFVFIFMESLITTNKAYLVYFIVALMYAYFSWGLFYFCFDLKKEKITNENNASGGKNDNEKEKEEKEEKLLSAQTAENQLK